MVQREEGWPLGLIRTFDFFDSVSFSTVNTASSRSTWLTSSDFESESFGSLSQERNVTLGSFIGIRRSVVEMSRRSSRRSRRHESLTEKKVKNKTWFSLCAKPQLEFEEGDGSASLGQFLEMERKARNLHGSSGVQSGGCRTNNGHGLPLILQCIGGQVNRLR